MDVLQTAVPLRSHTHAANPAPVTRACSLLSHLVKEYPEACAHVERSATVRTTTDRPWLIRWSSDPRRRAAVLDHARRPVLRAAAALQARRRARQHPRAAARRDRVAAARAWNTAAARARGWVRRDRRRPVGTRPDLDLHSAADHRRAAPRDAL